MKINKLMKQEDKNIGNIDTIYAITRYGYSITGDYDLYQVEETEALSFRGDLYGLLKKNNHTLSSLQIRIIARYNGYTNSQDYDGTQTIFRIPDLDKIKKLSDLL